MIPAPVALPVYGDLPPPPGYVLDEHSNVGLIAGGLVTFGTLYGVSIIYGGTQGFSEGMGNVAVPVIGPWLAIAARDLSCTDNTTIEGAQQCQQETIDETAKIAVLSGLGIGQLIGATLTVIGIFDKDQMWVRADAVDVSFRVDTMNVTGGSGVRLHGEF